MSDRPLCKCHGEPMRKNGKTPEGRQVWACAPKSVAAKSAWKAKNPDKVKAMAEAQSVKRRGTRNDYFAERYEANREEFQAQTRERQRVLRAQRMEDGVCVICSENSPRNHAQTCLPCSIEDARRERERLLAHHETQYANRRRTI